jgi:ribosomal protein L37AE/L43A
MKKRLRIYKCPKCGKKVKRLSGKKWVKSYCEETGQHSRLSLLTNQVK